MALIIADRVKETATTTGTGTFTLGGAVTGFRTFNAGIGTGNTTYYCIFLDGTNEFEVGLGTYTAPDQLARDTVLASSNSGSKVNFSQGIKSVFCTQPSSKAAYLDASGNLSITTSNITEGTNLYYTDARFDTRLATKDTADLSEGTNLYYTNARARAAISVSGNAIAYNSSTGVITANFEESPTFTGNVVVSGNLTVTGTTTWLDSTNTQISDKNIVLNYASGDSSANANGAGITIQDAVNASTDATILWDATNDEFDFSHGITLPDSKELKIGTGSDLKLWHSGSGSNISHEGTGDLTIRNTTDDADIKFMCDDGSGGVTDYFLLDGSQAQTKFEKDAQFADNIRVKVGGAGDMHIYHDGSNNYIRSFTGDITLQNDTDNASIYFRTDDGSGGTTPYMRVNGSDELINFHKNSKHMDSVKATFGDSGDLEIYHDGSNSYIKDTGTGDLFLGATNLRLTNGGVTATYLQGTDGGAVDIRYNNSVKLATTSTGIDVTGDITLTGNVFTDEGFYGNRVWNEDNSSLRFATNNTEVARFDSSGNLGIGTTSPQELLHLSGSSNTVKGLIQNNSTSTSAYATLGFQSDYSHSVNPGLFLTGSNNTNYAGANSLNMYQFGDFPLGFVTNNALKMIIKGNGNVGIGTDSPTQELQVNGNIKLETTGSEYVFAAATASNNVDAGHRYHSTEEYVATFTGASERMRIDSSGNVGIGTTNPSEKLQISHATSARARFYTTDGNDRKMVVGTQSSGGGEVTVQSNNQLTFGTNDTERMRITSSGNVLIGATLPKNTFAEKTLSVISSANNSQGMIEIGGNGTSNSFISGLSFTNEQSTDTSNFKRIAQIFAARDGNNNAGDLVFNVHDGSTFNRGMTIKSDGKIGIGTNSPSAKLDVAGTFEVDHGNWTSSDVVNVTTDQFDAGATYQTGEFLLFGDWDGSADKMLSLKKAGTDVFMVDRNGKVGIGTDSPAYKTEIVGGGNYSQLRLASSVSDNTNKYSGLSFEQYDVDEEGFLGLGGFSSSSENAVLVGGGTSTFNAATRVSFMTAANGTTTSGSERMRIDSSGNVGIGTTSPSVPLHVAGGSSGTNQSLFRTSSGGGGGFQIVCSDLSVANPTWRLNTFFGEQLAFGDGTTEKMRLDSSGKVGIGTTSPSQKLTVDDGTGASTIGLQPDGTNGAYIRYGGSSGTVGNTLRFLGVGNTEYARFNQSGNFGIGTTHPDSKLDVTGGDITVNTTSTGLMNYKYNNSVVGSITTNGISTAFNTSSDARLKNITGSARGLAVINELNPVAYDWKVDGKSDEGLIAQEVKELVPNAVSQNEDGYYQMDYSKLVTPLIKAVQELTAKVESLEAQLANK